MESSDRASIQPFALAPAIGAAFGLFLVLGSIAVSATSFQAFFSLGGLIIVVGGVVAVAFMSFQTGDVAKALHSITTILRQPVQAHEDLRSDMRCIMEWAHLVNEKGTRGLESKIDRSCASDPFINYGLNMVLSDYSPDDVRAMMSTAADVSCERDCVPVEVLGAMASHAPAFGMVGTLIGMVTMLGSLSDRYYKYWFDPGCGIPVHSLWCFISALDLYARCNKAAARRRQSSLSPPADR